MAVSVTVTDLQSYLGDSRLDTARGELMIEKATEACASVVNPIPDGAAFVVLRVAARAYSTVTSPRQPNLADAGSPFGASGGMGGVILTQYDIADLQRFNTDTPLAATIRTVPQSVGVWDAAVPPSYGYRAWPMGLLP